MYNISDASVTVRGLTMNRVDSTGHETPVLDGIFIINPRSFTDRRVNIERQLRSIGLPYEFIHSFDVEDLNAINMNRYFKKSLLSPQQQSCALKHLEALRLIVERKWQHALILEDDAILSPWFVQGLCEALKESTHLDEPHVLFIGSGGNLYTPRKFRVPGRRLYKSDRGRLAEAYVLGIRAARLRIEWIEEHGIPFPIDNLFEQIDRERGISLYWLEPPVVEQGSKNGRFRSVLESSPPNVVQRFIFLFQKLRRKYLY